uniref:Probable arginine--tRNA ligase, mitochondrial n=1 Tax=Photinus pyralis TaxID=7054 RepID=A0A1Y1KMU0_PHOPY
MSTKIKLYLGRKVIESLRQSPNINPVQLKPLIQIGNPPSDNHIEFYLPINAIEQYLGIASVNDILKIQPDDIIKNIHCVKDRANRKISFEINRDIFVKDVIENSAAPDVNLTPKNIVIEYSSPNIAKPFHVGHLRSTIIGNFLANLHTYLNHKVTRLNYLGDWGTQFGFIRVGVNKLNFTEEDIKQNPTQLLYESYVHANQLAESDPKISELARGYFAKLESGSEADLQVWRSYIDYTISDLQATYDRLGVKFDEYNYESMYNVSHIKSVLDALSSKKLLNVDTDGKVNVNVNDRNICLIKSDGSSLYLTRDLAAAIDRFSKFNFDQMYYVVENGQNDHFNSLKGLLHLMDVPWSDRIKHIKFGRIHGMSTRKGKVVFLRDLLNEIQDLMLEKQMESPNTKVPITNGEISDVLGVSCVIVNDLKQRRQKDYTFSWDQALQVQGDSGAKLQYTHCRLCSLEENSGAVPVQVCKPEFLEQPDVTALVRELARFPDVLHKAQSQMEACVLVTYLFHLCNYINRAFKTLQVKDQEPELASQRLLLFSSARDVLGQGMQILGLKPLTKM